MRRRFHWLLGLLLASVSSGLFVVGGSGQLAPEGFSGMVTDIASGAPIAGAEISAAGRATTTDASGRYVLSLPSGTYQVRAGASDYIGMRHVRQRLGAQGAQLNFEMVPQNPTPQEVAVIDGKMRRLSQDLPDGTGGDVLASGFAASAVTQVPGTVRVLMPDGTVVAMPMDEYLKGVVPHEMPPHWPIEALKAQAIAARSYAATRRGHPDEGADVCTTVHCQVWAATHYDTTDQAIDDTHGVTAKYDGNIIYAFFFGHCDGHTRNSEDVWGGYLPYCRSVPCPGGFTFMWGHGVGLCQEGSRVFAEQGYNHRDILTHYYTGTTVDSPTPGHIVGASVLPLTGDENTQFQYWAEYRSALGDLPAVANVIVDGRAHSLERVPGDSGDSHWYRLTTRLSVGEHTHRFYFDDGHGNVSSVPELGASAGPAVSPSDPAAPTPTPPPSPPGGTLATSITASTVADWAEGTADGTVVIDVGDGALTLAAGYGDGTHVSPIVTMSAEFIALGAIWYADIPDGATIHVDVKTALDGATWTDWIALRPDDDDSGRLNLYSSDLVFGLGAQVQYRVRLHASSAQSRPNLESLRLVAIDSREGPGPSADGRSHKTLNVRPPVVTRSAWGADETAMTWSPETRAPRTIILHLTGTSYGELDPAAAVRALYYYHAVVREWGDIGYNYLVDRSGNVYEGRAGGIGVVGSHAGRFDWGSIGIALLGDASEVSLGMREGLTGFMAWQSADHFIDPLGETYFIDTTLPTIADHRAASGAVCPGDDLVASLPEIRAETLAQMADVPPHVSISSPGDGTSERAVLIPAVDANAVVTAAEAYVDGVLRATEESLPLSWRWNTRDEIDGTHTLRIVASNAAGFDADEVMVHVDNTPPLGEVSVPAWHNSTWVPFGVAVTDASAIQFSNGWVWEGESLNHSPGTGHVVADVDAWNGQAWQGRGAQDAPGGWYGPYTCELPSWQDYKVYYRLKTPARAITTGLVTIDIVDDRGGRLYAHRALAGLDFAQDDVYEEFRLDLDYDSQWPTCDDPDTSDGLEFRTWFAATADLSLDRVAVFSRRDELSSPYYWQVRGDEGEQVVLVRLLDSAGNALDRPVTVKLDMSPPDWPDCGPSQTCVQDALSGLDTGSAEWSISLNGGVAWGAWQPLYIDATSGITESVLLTAPHSAGTHVRFRIADVAGNSSESAAQPISDGTATTTPTTTLTPTFESTLPPQTRRTTIAPTVGPGTATPDASTPEWTMLPIVLR